MGQDMIIEGFVGAPGIDEDSVAIINDYRQFTVCLFLLPVDGRLRDVY